MEEKTLAFALAVYKVPQMDGKIAFKIHSDNKELPDEMMLTMVKHWLRRMEDIYQSQLSSKFLI